MWLCPVLTEALAVVDSEVRLFTRSDSTDAGSWLAPSTATAPDPFVARDRARRVAAPLRRLR